jgi:hypothetical protein
MDRSQKNAGLDQQPHAVNLFHIMVWDMAEGGNLAHVKAQASFNLRGRRLTLLIWHEIPRVDPSYCGFALRLPGS